MADRDHNIRVFEDTKEMYSEDKRLKDIVNDSLERQRIFLEDEDIPCPPSAGYDTKVTVSGLRTFEAAAKYKGERTAVLNFADWHVPGGLVEYGASSQEEALCRVSTLYPCISSDEMMKGFYGPHRSGSEVRANDDIILTPDVLVFKSDEYPNGPLPDDGCFFADVITCAAPNLMNDSIPDEELYLTQKRRLGRILRAAHYGGAENIVLGAFGCGAFCNDPHIVAEACRDAMKGTGGWFRNVEFAIYCRESESVNHRVFREVFSD